MRADESVLDEFCDALWLEDGLSRNTLDSYRRDLRLFGYCQWDFPRQTLLRRGAH